MDPDATLAEMLDISRADQSEFHDDIHRLCELTLALHEFLSKGGFLPAAWRHNRSEEIKEAFERINGVGYGAFGPVSDREG